MRYLFISDFHLGSPLFSREYALTRILLDGYDKVFLVGDILDIQEAPLDAIISEYHYLISLINQLDNVIIIKGNHDPSIGDLSKVFTNAMVRDSYTDDFGIVTHGDAFDKFLGTLLYTVSFKAFYVFERLGINTKMMVRNAYARILSLVKNKPLDSLLFHYEINVVKHYGNCFDNIVMGHSHLPKIVDCGNCKYINCGDWIHNKTYVEYVDGEFKLLGV